LIAETQMAHRGRVTQGNAHQDVVATTKVVLIAKTTLQIHTFNVFR
jgi:hypothetical protein